ncbi:MAG: rRNA pseudouridine synthase [Candidatus Tectomicrobia bacterium]|nr:rRNA pseudouridine synthase [Candidatus Tectomicrobia bacterium]
MDLRLQKILSQAGIASRRRAEELILAGVVTINGKVVRELGIKADPDHDAIKVNGKLVRRPEPKIYLLLNKPRGYVTTTDDEKERPTVLDLLHGVKSRVYPVGRLDYDAEGILLFTNDGEIAYSLTHPKHEVPRTYLVKVRGIPTPEKLRLMMAEYRPPEGAAKSPGVKLKRRSGKHAWLELTLYEGRHHQVKQMCEKIGHPVLKLRRIRFASLTLNDLKPGEYRFLIPKEIEDLKKFHGIGL